MKPGSLVGRVFGDDYTLEALLGRGGFADVYRAARGATQQPVAVKILRLKTGADHAPSERQIARFRREMQACGSLEHPHIVGALDSGCTEDGLFYSVFEYLPGTPLSRLLAEEGALELERARQLGLQVLDALISAHDHGIIHRDLKPSNVLILETASGLHAKVLDFGIAALSADADTEDTRLTRSDEMVGTVSYAAPEQLRGEPPTTKVDLYAWGLVILECLTGRPAFTNESYAEALFAQLSPQEVPLPASLRGHALGSLLHWVLQKAPGRRASDCRQVHARLQRMVLDDLPQVRGYLQTEGAPGTEPGSQGSAVTVASTVSKRGERRQLTALACRIELEAEGEAVDDELCDELLRDLHASCTERVRARGGYLTGSLADQFVAVFGFPRADEHDARHAAELALELTGELELRSRLLRARHGLSVRLRAGVHTGMVTLHDDDARHGGQLVGTLESNAVRLTERASAGEVLISDSSSRLLRRALDLESTEGPLRGVGGRPLRVHRLLGESPVESLRKADRVPLVGRDAELGRLERAWAQAASGTGRVLVAQGEAGIGKSRLARALRERVSRDGGRWLGCGGSAGGENRALRPVVDLLTAELGLRRDAPEQALARLRAALEHAELDPAGTLAPLCMWLGLPTAKVPPVSVAPQRQREIAIEAMAQLAASLCRAQPAVLLVEDAHWLDPSSLEWLQVLARLTPSRPLLLLVLTRPTQAGPTLAEEELLRLEGLSPEAATDLITRLAGDKTLSSEVVERMVERGDGVPLFLEEITHMAAEGQAGEAIPEGLRSLLTARLDGLGAARETLQLAAVVGRAFELELLEELTLRDEAGLLADLEQLVDAHLIRRQRRVGSPAYTFRHALIRDAAYDSLVRPDREDLHRRTAHALEQRFSALASENPQLLANHWALGSTPERAVHYARIAATDLLMRSANSELVTFTQKALEWARGIADPAQRVSSELDLLGPAMLGLMRTRGWGDPVVQGVVERTVELLGQSPGHPQAFPLRFATCLFHHSHGVDRKRARELAEEMYAAAEKVPRAEGATLQMMGEVAMLFCSFLEGNFEEACERADRVLGRYEVAVHGPLAWQSGFDLYVSSACGKATICWIKGRFGEAWELAEDALACARKVGHPDSLALAMFYRGALYQFEGESERVIASTRELGAFAKEQSLALFSAFASLYEGWARGDAVVFSEALEFLQMAGQNVARSYNLAMGVETAGLHTEEGRAMLNAAFDHAEASGENYWLSPLLRLRALRDKDATAFRKACEVAREQGAGAFRVQAALDWLTTTGDAAAVDELREAVGVLRGASSSLLRRAEQALDALGEVE